MVNRYRKVPYEIDAFRWTPGCQTVDWAKIIKEGYNYFLVEPGNEYWSSQKYYLSPGDYIIRQDSGCGYFVEAMPEKSFKKLYRIILKVVK